MKRHVVLITGLLIPLTVAGPSSASTVINSPTDVTTMSGVPLNFDIDFLGYQEFSGSPNKHFFFIWMKDRVASNQFNDAEGSLAAIELNVNFMDGVADYRVETTKETLSGLFGSSAKTFLKQSGSWVESKNCGAQFYGNMDQGSDWVAFAVPYNCFNLPKSFGINGYTEFRSNGNKYVDWSFDSESKFFLVSHSFTPEPKVTQPKSLVEIGSFRGNWAVVIKNGRGSTVSIRENNRWHKFKVPNNNYLFKRGTKSGKKVDISVWVDGTLMDSKSIIVK